MEASLLSPTRPTKGDAQREVGRFALLAPHPPCLLLGDRTFLFLTSGPGRADAILPLPCPCVESSLAHGAQGLPHEVPSKAVQMRCALPRTLCMRAPLCSHPH